MSDLDVIISLYNEKKFQEALDKFAELDEDSSKTFDALKYKGLINFELKNYKEARDSFKEAISIKPDSKIEGNLGLSYFYLKSYESAQIHLINSIVEKYDDKFANTLEKSLLIKHNDEAMLGVKLLMHENHPKNVFILRDITNLAQKLKNFEIAFQYFDILLKLCPDDYVAWNNLGLIYEETGDWKKAYDCYKKALSINDFFSPNFNLGIMSRKLHNFEDSIKYLKKAVMQNPNSPQPKYSLSMSYMMLKDFKQGYPLYAKHMTVIMPFYYKNEWDGTPHPDKTLCIFTTGGLGDMIMYARYFDCIKNYFKKIYLLLPESLHKIFKRNFPYLEIIDSKVIFTDYDYAITPMHILKFFDMDFTKSVPMTEGFLKADSASVSDFKNRLFNHDKLKIALNWHGNREGTRTFFNRSMPVEMFGKIIEKYKSKAVFYSIQKDETHTDASKIPEIIDLYDEIKDFDDTASILKNMDLLISIDSSPVHMAGALGVKTFVLLPYANEWRWFVDDNDTVWYDSVHLFRQNKEGDWESAVNKVYDEMDFTY